MNLAGVAEQGQTRGLQISEPSGKAYLQRGEGDEGLIVHHSAS
jgi:hypothetical protein